MGTHVVVIAFNHIFGNCYLLQEENPLSRKRKYMSNGIIVFVLSKVMEKCIKIIIKNKLKTFSVQDMVVLLKEEKFRNIPSDVGLGQMFRMCPLFKSGDKTYLTSFSGNTHRATLWRVRTKKEFLSLIPRYAVEFKGDSGDSGEEYEWTNEDYVRSHFDGRT